MHHVRTSHGAGRTNSYGDIPARQEPFATVTGAKHRQQAPQARVRDRRRSAEGPQGRSGGRRGLQRSCSDGRRFAVDRWTCTDMMGRGGCSRPTGSRAQQHDDGGCPARRANGYKVRIVQVFRPSRRLPFAVAHQHVGPTTELQAASDPSPQGLCIQKRPKKRPWRPALRCCPL